MSAVQRKYQMTRLRRGDYLLPSNDAQTLWRIHTYYENGSVEGLKGTFWAASKWDDAWPTIEALAETIEMNWWERWIFWSGPFNTRAEAIQDALSAGERITT